MQADGRLVQDIEHVHELGADLRRQADALALAAGQGCRGAVQRQVVQAHVQHELDPLAQFFQDVAGHVQFPLVEAGGDVIEPLAQLGHFHGGHIGDGLAVDPETEGFLGQAGAVAVGAYDGILDMVDHASPGLHLGQAAVAHPEQFVGAVHEQHDRLVREGADGLVQAEAVFPGDGADDVELPALADLPQRDDGPVGDGLGAVRDDGIDIHVHDGAEALAVRAVALRRIEGERVRLRLLEGSARHRVHQMLGEMLQRARFQVHHGHRPLAHGNRLPHGVAHPLVVPRPGLEAVHDELDEMRLVAVQGLYALQFEDFPVDADLRVAALPELVEQLAVMALAAPHERRQQVALAVPVRSEDEVHDLAVGVAHHLLAGFRRDGARTLRVQQAEEVVDFRDGTHGGTGVVPGGLLLDGDDRAQAADLLHLGLLEDAHEVLRVRGQGVHVPALAFRIDRIERQRGLSAAGKPRHDDELPSRDVHVDILQVVRLRAPYLYVFLLLHRIAKVRKKTTKR